MMHKRFWFIEFISFNILPLLITEKMQRHQKPDWSNLAPPLLVPEVHIRVPPPQDPQQTVLPAANRRCQQKPPLT